MGTKVDFTPPPGSTLGRGQSPTRPLETRLWGRVDQLKGEWIIFWQKSQLVHNLNPKRTYYWLVLMNLLDKCIFTLNYLMLCFESRISFAELYCSFEFLDDKSYFIVLTIYENLIYSVISLFLFQYKYKYEVKIKLHSQ